LVIFPFGKAVFFYPVLYPGGKIPAYLKRPVEFPGVHPLPPFLFDYP
jgi:hypothetical protein